MKKIIIIMLVIAVLVLSVLFFLQLLEPEKRSITIGSKIFPESQVLGEIISILIEENTDIEVNRKFWLGGTLICFEALKTGEIDIYVEYTGTAWAVILKKQGNIPDKETLYNMVKEEFAAKYNLHWGKPFGFNNTYIMVVTEDYPIKTISELKSVEKEIRLGLTHEFMNREDGFPAMCEFYGLNFLNVRAMDHTLTYRAMKNGDVDATEAYATDGTLYSYKFKKLKDDKNFFPPYYAAPILPQTTLQKYPEIESLINQLENILDDDEMTHLNYLVEIEKKPFYDVAFDFLVKKKLIPENISKKIRKPRVLKLLKQHIFLVFLSTLIAILIGVPLGILIAKQKYLASPILGITGILQTIPSLAILAFTVPIFGIGFVPSMFALILYALLPIVRNAYTGIISVDPELKEAATAMGMTPRQTLFMLEIPLATKIIMAGVRTAAVISVGTATLAAFIGGGGLGELILTGITLNDTNLILQGTIPAAGLALIVDYFLGLAENLLEPEGLKVSKS